MPEITTYIKNLRKLREKRGLTQQEVGEILGISQSAYARYERCANEIPIKHYHKLIQYYGVSSDVVLGLKEGILE